MQTVKDWSQKEREKSLRDKLAKRARAMHDDGSRKEVPKMEIPEIKWYRMDAMPTGAEKVVIAGRVYEVKVKVEEEHDYASMTRIRTITREVPVAVSAGPGHKSGHLPIDWMIEANERAQQSEKLITIQIEKEGVVVIGQEGENYETHILAWMMMDKAEVNPIILAIETVERHLNTLGNLQKRVAYG